MRAWTILAALAVSTFLYVTTETLPIGLLPQIADDVGSTPGAVGLLVTAYGLVVVMATIPLTRLTHRFSRRRLLTVLLLVMTAATALSALAPTYPALLAGRVAIALSQAVFWAVVTPAAAALFPAAKRGRAISILFAGSSAGPLLGVPGGTWLGQQTAWRVPFLVLALLGLAVSAVIVLLMPDLAPGTSETEHGTAPDRARFRGMVVTTVLTVTGFFAAFTCINPFLAEVVGLGEPAIGPLLLVRGLAGLFGVFAAGFVASRLGWHAMVVSVAGLAAALVAQYLFRGVPVLAVAAVALAAFTLSSMNAVLARRVLEIAPGTTDMASAATSTAFNVGITVGALIGSRLLSAGQVALSPLVAGLIVVAALACVAAEPWAGRRESRRRSTEDDRGAYYLATR
jgi:MFS transporter, DHA1 family, inner membrane transport protein